jgi:signal transduction histidine kinase
MIGPDTDRTWQMERERLRGLIAAGIALGSELSLDDLLEKLVRTAAELTGARYAALGVLDRTGTALERFVTTGVDEQTRRRIGDAPRGRGILGVLIRDARPLRLRDLQDDPRSVGFPPGHPPMRSFLGVPILVRGVPFGNLYMTEKPGGDFTDEDEEVAVLLASQAAVAIDNAHLYETATAWMRQLESLSTITRDLSEDLDPQVVLERVCTQVCELVDAETALVSLVSGNGGLRLATIAGEAADEFRASRPPPEASKAHRVLARGRAERIDATVDDPEIDQRLARQLSIRSALMVPMRSGREPLGLLTVCNRRGGDGRFTDNDLRIAELFAERAAQAIDVSQRVSRQALERAVAAQETERQRLGNELHDDAGQMLAAILMGIRQAARSTSDRERDEAHAHVIDLVEETVDSLRRLSHQLRPRTLEQEGLGAALSELGRQFSTSDLELVVESRVDGRLDPDVELALFRLAQEAVTNIVNHAEASHARVSAKVRGVEVVLTIEDDGNGFDVDASMNAGLGLVTMRERLELLGGTLDVVSRSGSGTILRARVPA